MHNYFLFISDGSCTAATVSEETVLKLGEERMGRGGGRVWRRGNKDKGLGTGPGISCNLSK